jgi:Tfp pilus assembly protein PilF
LAVALLTGLGCFALHGELQQWVQWSPAGALQAIFFRPVAMPGGTVNARRPPAETRPALADQIFKEPNQAELYRLRAREDELQLDFTAADEDWRKYAQMSGANLELADFYHRRIRPTDELAALELVTKTPSERWTPATEQTAWQAFERILEVDREQDLPEAQVYTEWIARYPAEPLVRQRWIAFLVSKRLYAEAAREIGNYEKAFPKDIGYPVLARASIEVARGSVDQAIAVYDRAFQPLWPDDVMAGYFQLLEGRLPDGRGSLDAGHGKLREFLGRNRAAIAANPENLDAATRLFAYYHHQQNQAAAGRVLIEFRLNKESHHLAWTATELSTLGQLFEKVGDSNEAARCYYALYSSPGGEEQAIAGLAGLLLNHSDQQIRFGSGDLSFYKDIATMDSSPGFLNGILSLLLNGTRPRRQYQQQDEKAALYFHRASAAELLALLDKRFPQSASRDPLRAALIDAYAQYGENDAVIPAGRDYLIAFPNSAHRLTVALLVADALARLDRTAEEYALYDQLLKELAAKADGVPLGRPRDGQTAARQPEYQQVLDHYISRLTANEGAVEVLKLYRREIDRNPNDPGLYERLAGYLEANHMFDDVEQVYRQAIQKLNDKNWYTSLARYYIRRKRHIAMSTLTREVTKIFSGSELERYFNEAVAEAPLDDALYQQVNLFAHERFPDDLVFVKNLLNVYQRRAERVEYTKLLRNYWFYDPQLKTDFFAALSSQNQLNAELDAVRKAPANPAAQMFLAEGEAWRSHFETAAPYFHTVADAFPGDKELNERASSVFRSLELTAVAVKLQENVLAADPRDRDALARVGDIYMDHDQFAQAKPYWDRMAAIEPGRSEGVLEAATVFWDYYHFDDALRLIDQGRRKFGDPALFAYQAGAIDEGKRDYQAAVREYAAGALAKDPAAEQRLIRLSRRPALHAIIDSATAPADGSLDALNLRIAVLEAQSRRADLGTLLSGAAASSRDLNILTRVDEEASKQGFDEVVQQAMEREIESSGDPVEKMQLRIALARYFEGKSNLKAARATIQALDHDNPEILGVVRATVDFYVRVKEPKQAVATLLAAAKTANPSLRREFTMEAARRAEESGDYAGSRTIMAGVLKSEPNAADALALMAATYADSGDDAGLKQFALASIAALKTAPLTADERTARIAALRRGLIPALTRQHDFNGAVEQYIEVINRYPDDAGLTDEASGYAIQHQGNAGKLLAFYRNTIADAPRDYRWPIVLARIETDTEDYPAAIASYTQALDDRPDRRDVLEARARLEERLMRFDEAEASFRRLYELSYHDPQWMLKAGEICARLGKTQQAVDAVHQAFVGTGSETALELFAIAATLEEWELIPQAAGFAERGLRLAGDALYEKPEYAGAAVEYLRLETRMRRYEAPYQRMNSSARAQALGQAAAQYFTPEEKYALATFLQARYRVAAGAELETSLLPIANAAGLQDLRARWMFEQDDPQLGDVQTRRGQFEELGAQMEALAKRRAGQDESRVIQALEAAAAAYRSGGDDVKELRVLEQWYAEHHMFGDPLERYFVLVYKANPNRIIELARSSDAATDFAERTGNAAFAQQAVTARRAKLSPQWNTAYTALTGLYYSQNTPAIDGAFVSVLGDGAIGDRIAQVDRAQQLAGNIWFYYGSRYGEYLAAFRKAASEDFLPATLEAAPGNADAYFQLGDYYQSAGQPQRAITEFELVLQLHPDAGMADNRIAECLWSEGRHPAAVARWRGALAKMQRVQSRGVAVPADYWYTVTSMIRDIGKNRLLPQLQPEVRGLLLDYMNRNQSYQLEPLLSASLEASIDSGSDIGWVIDVAARVVDAESELSIIQRAHELTSHQQEAVARALVSVAEWNVTGAHGDEAMRAAWDRDRKRLDLIDLLLGQKKTGAAQAEWDRLPREAQKPETEMQLAAQSGRMPELVARYRKQPESAPPLQTILQTAAGLKETDKASALLLLDFAYSRELDSVHYDESNFLGMASVRLEQGNTDAALASLHRMNLIAGQPFETFVPAADLLIQFGKKQEAIPFLEARARAVPWDWETKLRLGDFAALVTNNQAPYAIRLKAAQGIGKPVSAGSGELDAIAAGSLSPANAEHPYYVKARELTADRTANGVVKLRLLREALSINPESDEIRRSLGRVAFSQKHDELGVSVLEPLLAQPDHLQIAVDLSAAEDRLGNPQLALQYAQTALQSQPGEAARKRLESNVTRFQAALNLRGANDARRPEIHEPLEQNHPVRPRRSK